MGSRTRLIAILVAGLLIASLVGVAPAGADDRGWEHPSGVWQTDSQLIGPPARFICPDGDDECVDETVEEMTERYERLIDRCDPDALFALLYLRTTEVYHRIVTADPNFFDDLAWLNHYDTVFAEAYFDARDLHKWGASPRVPDAWRIAFRATERDEVTSLGSVLLGMNAHINRDLPFVLADIGLTAPDGDSRHADHTKVNEFLAQVDRNSTFAEIAARFDPTIGQQDPGLFTDPTLVPDWRQTAWENARRLVNADSPHERAEVAADIESDAADTARQIVATMGPEDNSVDLTPDGGDYGEMRDEYCAAQQPDTGEDHHDGDEDDRDRDGGWDRDEHDWTRDRD